VVDYVYIVQRVAPCLPLFLTRLYPKTTKLFRLYIQTQLDMRLPNQTYPTSHPSSISHVGESLNITLYIDSQQPISYRPIERADKVIVSFPAYRHPTQKPPPSVFVFQPAPTIFILPSTDSTIQCKYMRSGKHRMPRS
jgi:hypothetical protein